MGHFLKENAQDEFVENVVKEVTRKCALLLRTGLILVTS